MAAAAATGPSNTSLAWTTTSRWRPTGNGALARCRPARPDLGWRWPSWLVATAAEDRLSLPTQHTRRLRQPAIAEVAERMKFGPPRRSASHGCGRLLLGIMRTAPRRTAGEAGPPPREPSSRGHRCLFMPTSCLPVRVLFRPASSRRASPPKPTSCRPAACGCMRLSTTIFGLSPGRTARDHTEGRKCSQLFSSSPRKGLVGACPALW